MQNSIDCAFAPLKAWSLPLNFVLWLLKQPVSFLVTFALFASSRVADLASENLHPDQLAWNTHGAESATIHGATISSPSITRQLPDKIVQKLKSHASAGGPDSTPQLDFTAPHPPPDGFILSGSIELFGIRGLKADFYSHHGPISAPANIPAGTIPIYQVAYLDKDLRISSILPDFAGTHFDILNFKEVSFTYQVRATHDISPVL